MKILVTTSTLPAHDTDTVPAFVKDQVIAIKQANPAIECIIHAPHNFYSRTTKSSRPNQYFREIRYHYFWPFRFELLSGRGIMPALRQNKLLYMQIPFFVLFQFVALLTVAKKEKPDLIYAHWFTPQAITSALVSKITGIPFIFTTHASDVSILHKFPFTKQLVHHVCQRASAFTAVSRRTADKLISFFNHDDWTQNFALKLEIIPMGTETKVPTVGRKTLVRVQKKYNLPTDKRILLFIGRLAEKKGVTYLLEAFSNLPENIANGLHLVIAGDGQLLHGLQKQAKQLRIKNSTFTGYLHGEEKRTLFALAGFICLPSIVDSQGDSEGFPVVLMEGLAAGKIVLASNASGGETILTNGETGFVFPEKSSGELSKAILLAASLSREQRIAIQTKAKSLAQQFSWDTIADRQYQIFEKALIK
jgi:glycosyltransferase involved in cell wall biosynthesis